jgi:C_GCAxxG_C_C family probable redox protein
MTRSKTEEIGKEAIELFRDGYICAEAVSKVVLDQFKFDSNKICGVATGFGGGIAKQGQTCGALTGGIISIGAVINDGFRRPDQEEIKEVVYQNVQDLFQNFEEKFGSTICRNITGCDFKTKEGLKKFYDEEMGKNICAPIVDWTAKETLKLLES